MWGCDDCIAANTPPTTWPFPRLVPGAVEPTHALVPTTLLQHLARCDHDIGRRGCARCSLGGCDRCGGEQVHAPGCELVHELALHLRDGVR